ncbi:tetratricopeptide repeat protein [Heyndrickxia ginsengihumi]|uniref:tetratricopeptide repeat protein n=1 Tax=Heyndrickxia ginsengihumi TaxID=363870 RepID=UPI000ABFD702|nr:tetratricopeptide repeat protein [Heyndrickxia ginsengihumi]
MDKFEKGLEALRQKQFDEALRLFNELIEKDPQDPLGYIHFGDVLLAVGEYTRAQNFYIKALQLKELPAPYYSLGTIQYKEGRYEEAAGFFEKALRLGMKDKDTYFMLGMCFLLMNNPRFAIPYLQRSVELDPMDIDAKFQFGLALVKANLHKEALQYFQQVIDHDPNHADAYYNIGAIYVDYYHQPEKSEKFF